MSTAKRLFLRKEPGKQSLAEWWVTVVHDDRFQQVVTYARAHAYELHWPIERLIGGDDMLETLQTLADNEETFAEFPGPGLQHRMPVKGEEKKD